MKSINNLKLIFLTYFIVLGKNTLFKIQIIKVYKKNRIVINRYK